MARDILVVIPCLNEEQNIEKLALQFLQSAQTCPMRIIIADGGSSDNTVAIAKKITAQHSAITYLNNPKRIQAAAVNLAVAHYGADAEFLIRLDAHADYPDYYCQTLLQEAQTMQADAVVVSMDSQGKTPFQKAVAAAQNSKLGNGGSPHRTGLSQGKWVDHGHHALMRVDAFNHIGGYDEHFPHNEDAELDTRLIKAGRKIWLTAQTNLVYYPRSSPTRLFMQYLQYGKGRVHTILKHHTLPSLRQLAPAAILPAALLAPLCCWMAAPFFAWVIVCLAYGAWLGYKAHSSAIALSGPAAMIMHFAWSLGFWLGLMEYRNEY